VLQAVGLHLGLLVLLWVGVDLPRETVAEAARGEAVSADLAAASDLSASMQRALRRDPEPLPQPIAEPEPLPPDPETPPEVLPEPPVEELPPPVPDPAPVEQELVQRDADSAQVADVDREQEEKRRQVEQAELDAQRRRMEALAEIRRQRELAARERTMAEQRAQQLNDARTSSATPTRPPPGNPDSRLAESAGYQVALMNAILRQWTRPESVALGQVCQVLIRQIPGGEVVSVEISPSCPYDEQGRRSVEAAILKASPLPYAGFEDVFVRNPVLKFRAEDL
jgi:colicin import membrane protein